MNSYLVQYEVKTIITEKTIIIAETVDDAIQEALKKDNVIKVVGVKNLSNPMSARSSINTIVVKRHPVVELAKLYTELGCTTDPVERARIIAEIGVIKCGDW